MFNKSSIKKILILLSVSSVICDPLRKVPKIYNAVITSSDNLQPSKAYPVIQPVVQPAAVAYHVHYPHLHHSGSYVNFFQQHIYENPDPENNPSQPKPAERYGFIQIQSYHSPGTEKRTQRRLDNPPPTLNAAYSPPSQSSNLLQSLYHPPQKSNPNPPNPDSDPLLRVLQMVSAKNGNHRLSDILNQSHRNPNDSSKDNQASPTHKHPFPTGLQHYAYTVVDPPPLPSGSGNHGNEGRHLPKLQTTYQKTQKDPENGNGNPQGEKTTAYNKHKHPFQTGLHPYEYTIIDSPPLPSGSGNHGNQVKQGNKPQTTYQTRDPKQNGNVTPEPVKQIATTTDFQTSSQVAAFPQERGIQSSGTERLPNVVNQATIPHITYLKPGPKATSIPQGVSSSAGSSSANGEFGFQRGSPLQTTTGYHSNQEILPQNAYLTPSPIETLIPQRILTTKPGSTNRGPNSQGNVGSTNGVGSFQTGYSLQNEDGYHGNQETLPQNIYNILHNPPGTPSSSPVGNPQSSFGTRSLTNGNTGVRQKLSTKKLSDHKETNIVHYVPRPKQQTLPKGTGTEGPLKIPMNPVPFPTNYPTQGTTIGQQQFQSNGYTQSVPETSGLQNGAYSNGNIQSGTSDLPEVTNLGNGELPNGAYPNIHNAPSETRPIAINSNKYHQNVSPGPIQKHGNPQESFINGGYSGVFPGSHGVPHVPQFLETKGNDESLLEIPQGYGTTVFPMNPLQSSVAPGVPEVIPTVLGPHDLVPEGSPLGNLQGGQSQPFFGDYHYPVDSPDGFGSSTPTIGTYRSTSETNHHHLDVTSLYGKTLNKGVTTSPTSPVSSGQSSTLEPIGANTVQGPQNVDNQHRLHVTSKYNPLTSVPTTSEPLGTNTIQMPQFGDILNNHFRDKYPNIPDVPPPPLPTARKKLQE